MSEPASRRSLAALLRAELAPFPGRLREALLVALATTTALGFSIVLQVPSFAGPVVALAAMQRTTVCTWRNMVQRILLVVASGLVVVPLSGVLVQLPSLLVPSFFLILTLVTYGLPMTRRPVEGILVAFPVIVACYQGSFDPLSIPTSTRDLVCASAIGVITSTICAHLSSRVGPRSRLAQSLAASFDGARTHLTESLSRYLAERWPGDLGEAPTTSSLGEHVQLLDLLRQEGVTRGVERTLVTLTSAAERIETFVGAIDTLSRQDVGRTYRALIRPEIEALAREIDGALAGFASGARQMALSPGEIVPPEAPAWPDLHTLVDALERRQLEHRRAGRLNATTVGESTNTSAVVQSLASLADLLHTPPWELGRMAADDRHDTAVKPSRILPLDRYALRYALQVALGATIALVVGIASHVVALLTLLWNPVLVAQTSYGATIRKAWLRFFGVFVGGVLSILTIIAVFANSNDIAVWLALFFAVVLFSQYAALGSVAYSYGPFQIAVTYIIVLVAERPVVNVHEALWRAFGTLLGTAILFSVFRVVGPDYAGRQLIARFIDLLRTILVYLPRPGDTLPPIETLVATRLVAGQRSADLLRLIEEARLEGHASGIDTDAAIHASGLALRVSLRSGLVARGRATVVWPALSAASRMHLDRMSTMVREHLEIHIRVLEARDTMARPGTRAHRAACAAAAQELLRRPRPDVGPAVRDATAHFDIVRFTELADWPPDASGALFAELEHFHRMAELLPQLDVELEHMVLPDAAPEPADHRSESGAVLPRPPRPDPARA